MEGPFHFGANAESHCAPDRNMQAEASYVPDVSISRNVLTHFWIPERCTDR